MNPNRLVVPAVLLALSAPAAAETFQDWALFKVEAAVFGMRAADFDAAMAKHLQGAGLSHLQLYDLAAADTGSETSEMAVAAKPLGCLRLYPKSAPGVPMSVRLSEHEDTPDIPTRRVAATELWPYGTNTSGPGLKSFRGGWKRPIKVTVSGEPQPFCASLSSLSQLTPAEQVLADALREMDQAGYTALVKAAPADRGPLLDAVKLHLGHEPELVLTDGKPDIWASLHAIDKAALGRLPADQQAALKEKLATATNAEAAKALLGEIRKAVSAFISSNGDPGAMATLQAASRRLATAKLDPNTGAVTFDGAAPSVDTAVVVDGPGGPDKVAPAELYTGDPGKQGVVTSPLTAAPPKPMGSPKDDNSGGLLGKAGALLKDPRVAVAGGALAGALLGFMIGGPFGAVLGATFGMMGGLLLSQTFGGGPKGEA